jgi:D-glycero-D-manno-heptose 1,7-bisphosphate phosphatase
MKKIKAAFFDRDGTIIKDANYLSDFSKIEVVPEAIKLCLELQKIGYKLFVVTNQSGIARGCFDEVFVKYTHDYLAKLFEKEGVFFEKWYYCPHHPEYGNKFYKKVCNCRKPQPGMLLQAAQEYNIDLKKSFMFGDKLCDLQAGQAAGCKSFYIQNISDQIFV